LESKAHVHTPQIVFVFIVFSLIEDCISKMLPTGLILVLFVCLLAS